MQPISKQQIVKHSSLTTELLLERCFLFGPCKVVIKKKTRVTSSVEGWQFSRALQGRLRIDGDPVQLRAECLAVKKRVSCKSAAVKKRLYVSCSYNKIVIITELKSTSEE
jgi:hypothetical protein